MKQLIEKIITTYEPSETTTNILRTGTTSYKDVTEVVIPELIKLNVPDESLVSLIVDTSSPLHFPISQLYTSTKAGKITSETADFLLYNLRRAFGGLTSLHHLPRNPKTGRATLSKETLKDTLEYLKVQVAWNLMTCNIEITGLENVGFGPKMSDICEDWLHARMSEKDIYLDLKPGALQATIRLLAWDNRYHPVKNYLESLTWDGQARLDTWVIRHAKASDTAYTRAACALPLLAAVARIYEPGTKFDTLLVLCSEQGWVKSTAIKALLPDPTWFSDSLPLGVDTKTTIEQTSGKWILEAADLQGFENRDHNTLKAFMSRTVDTARLAYGRNTTDMPRQWVLIGTVNDNQFLDDPTGNRRYLPVKLGESFNVSALIEERNQIWAEAYHRVVVLGESVVLDKNLWKEAATVREEHTVDNHFRDSLAAELGDARGIIRNIDLWNLLNVPFNQRRGTNRLKKAMADLGWVQGEEPKRILGSVHRYWQKDNCEAVIELKADQSGRWHLPDDDEVRNSPLEQHTHSYSKAN